MSLKLRIIQYIIFISTACNFVFTDNTTLKLISVVFRHGDRTPIPPYELYPNDPYRNHNFTPPGYGKLTKGGELREYNLGKFLRDRYNEFLGSSYVPGVVEALSTDINRTKESLRFVLKALYPEVSLPPKFKPTNSDTLFFPILCPRYSQPL